jgi:hypothetical protein
MNVSRVAISAFAVCALVCAEGSHAQNPPTQSQNYAFGRNAIATGHQPSGEATGDLNGDGRPDLVVANVAENTVSIFLDAANGRLGSRFDYATGPNPRAVALGDFNGDGFLDIVVVNESCVLTNGQGRDFDFGGSRRRNISYSHGFFGWRVDLIGDWRF